VLHQEGERAREHQRRTDPLDRPSGDQGPDGRRHRAPHRRRTEPGEAEQDDPAVPEPVTDRAEASSSAASGTA
jgi:hypothetical protein